MSILQLFLYFRYQIEGPMLRKAALGTSHEEFHGMRTYCFVQILMSSIDMM